MKKITLLLTMLLGVIGGVSATTIWEGSSVIGNWSGSSVTVGNDAFTSCVAGNIIKVTFSAYAEKDGETDITYWQYSLGQRDNGWTELTGFSGNLTKGQKSASYILTGTNVTELKTYGLSVNGRYVTVTKVELLTTTSESVWTGSVTTEDWSTNLDLTYDNKGTLPNVQMNDYIKMTYTVTNTGAQAAIQNAGWNSLASIDDNSYVAEGDNTGKTLILTIEDAVTLEGIQLNGILGRGKNIIITAIDLIKPSNRYDAVPLTIGSDGITTYGSSKNLDFSGLTGVTPYYVSSVEKGSVTLTSVTATRAWAGYIVQGPAGTYDVPVANEEPEWNEDFYYLRYSGDYNGNWVYRSAYSGYSDGSDEETETKTKIKTYYRYIFAKDNSDQIGFYKLATDYERTVGESTVYYHVLAAHKAYLETPEDIAPTGSAPVMLMFNDSETTGIEGCSLKSDVRNNVYYNMNGQRVAHPTKGLYIVNGKKVIIK